MDTIRNCINCDQNVRISYQDGDTSKPLVFLVHTLSDHVTQCPGSRQLVDNQTKIVNTASLEAVDQPDLTPVPVSEKTTEVETSKNTARCPSCKQHVATKLNLRNNRVFVEHFFPSGLRCQKSMRPLTES